MIFSSRERFRSRRSSLARVWIHPLMLDPRGWLRSDLDRTLLAPIMAAKKNEGGKSDAGGRAQDLPPSSES
jgi:hypothetical protein